MRTLAEIPLREQDRRAIRAAAGLLRKRFPVAQVVLFGSKARGAGGEGEQFVAAMERLLVA